MAVIVDNQFYTGSYTPFERPPENTTLYSLIPRGVRRFFLQAAVPAKPLNDELRLLLNLTLPDSFAYVVRTFDAQIRGDTATDYNPEVILAMFNHIPGLAIGSEQYISIPLSPQPSTVGVENATTGPSNLHDFVSPAWSTHAGTITFRAEFLNVAAAAAAVAFINSYVEFLEYDLVQAQRYWINTPIPVLNR